MLKDCAPIPQILRLKPWPPLGWYLEMGGFGRQLGLDIELTCQGRRFKRHEFKPWVRKIPWRRKWLHYSCLGNPMDRGIWRATIHGFAKSWTRLSKHAHRSWRWDFISGLVPLLKETPESMLTLSTPKRRRGCVLSPGTNHDRPLIREF